MLSQQLQPQQRQLPPRQPTVPTPPLPLGPVAAPPTPPPAEARRPFQDLAAQHTKTAPRRHSYWWQTGPVVLAGGEEEVGH